MGRKKKEDERTCATCGRGPDKERCMDQEDCSKGDLWFPKEPDHQTHGERLSKGLDAIEKRHDELPSDCKISVNGGPAVPFPSLEATEQVTEMVKGHLEDQDGNPKVIRRSFIGKHVLEEFTDGMMSFDGGPRVSRETMKATVDAARVIKDGVSKATQLDLDMKPAEYPVDVEAEDYRVLTFECGSWTLKVREDRLESAAACNNITALVQRRLKASGDLYPLSEGEFDRWVQRFTKSLTNYVRTGCA